MAKTLRMTLNIDTCTSVLDRGIPLLKVMPYVLATQFNTLYFLLHICFNPFPPVL